MENVKICNLDILAPVQKRQIILGGQSYPVETLTVNSFIEFNKARLDISKSNGLEEGFKMAQALIKSMVPTISQEVLDALTPAQLSKLIAFIGDEIPDDELSGKTTEEAANAETNEGKE